nr:serine/threonine-protein phosphatase [bacterium]
SGDFFDYLEGKEPNEIALVVADVCGKAMKGAMNAVMADGVLRMAAKTQEQLSPASLMTEINDVLKVRMEWGMNITMVIVAICRNRVLAQGSVPEEQITLTLANAAHHAHPILWRDGEMQTLRAGGLPLGMKAGVQYTEEQLLLQSGDVLILMTDGIIEATDSKENDYSDSGRLEEIISQFTPDMPAEAMVDAIINDVIDYSGDKTQRDDDMTVVVAKIQ